MAVRADEQSAQLSSFTHENIIFCLIVPQKLVSSMKMSPCPRSAVLLIQTVALLDRFANEPWSNISNEMSPGALVFRSGSFPEF